MRGILDAIVHALHQGKPAAPPQRRDKLPQLTFVTIGDDVNGTIRHVLSTRINPKEVRLLIHKIAESDALHNAENICRQLLHGVAVWSLPSLPIPRSTPFTKLPDSEPPYSLASSTASLAAIAGLTGGFAYFIS